MPQSLDLQALLRRTTAKDDARKFAEENLDRDVITDLVLQSVPAWQRPIMSELFPQLVEERMPVLARQIEYAVHNATRFADDHESAMSHAELLEEAMPGITGVQRFVLNRMGS